MTAAPQTRRAIAAAARQALEGLEAVEPLRLSEWASTHFVLSADSSQQSGAWQPWPFQIGLLDMMGDDDVHELDVMKAKRVGYTKTLTASIGYEASYRRRNQALWQPTDDDRDSYVDTEIRPMLEDVPAVAKARRKRGGHKERIALKKFRGCLLHLLGGKAQRAYRRITIASAKGDEIDAFDRQIEGSLDPITGMRGRLEGAAFPKLILGTTPRVANHSHIETRVAEAAAVMRYEITCKHCGADHPLIWGGQDLPYGLVWDGEDAMTVRHVCPHCRQSITQTDYMPDGINPIRGRWRCSKTGLQYDDQAGLWRDEHGEVTRPPRHVALVDLWTAYSPQREWHDIVREYLESRRRLEQGDDGPMQGFVNETLARTYAVAFEATDADGLRARQESYRIGEAPEGVLTAVMYIDTQDDRWEYTVLGLGREGETWLVDTGVRYGNPADLREWEDKLDPLLMNTYRHPSGAEIGIAATGIDTGGHHTHTAYMYCRSRKAANVHGTKGESVAGKPIRSRIKHVDINHRGKQVKKGMTLHYIGTDTAKDRLYGLLKLSPAEGGTASPGVMHFPRDAPSPWFDQLTSEQRIPVRTPTGTKHRWSLPSGKRNEALDCVVGCLFLAEVVGAASWTAADIDRLEAGIRAAAKRAAPRPDQTEKRPRSRRPAPVARKHLAVPRAQAAEEIL